MTKDLRVFLIKITVHFKIALKLKKYIYYLQNMLKFHKSEKYYIFYIGVCSFKIKDNSESIMTISCEFCDFIKFLRM